MQQYREIFKIPTIQHDVEGRPDVVHIDKGVYCKKVNYHSAFMTDNNQKFFNLMNLGMYEVEDLAVRAVKVRSNNMNDKLLSPTKSHVMEREFFRFMIMKKHKYEKIDEGLKNCARYHRGSITNAKRELAKKNIQNVQAVHKSTNVKHYK